ncbi:hypothetical protein AB1Y20_001578 [Prymnesium parvum]|uniref:Uncharacterized protein n=1 Tax=Prymnesium parvum TaxID=97485 RepID=A0AB34KBS3_PRYPA
MSDQTFADVKKILLSQSSVKDIVISINAEYWGTDWAEHEADRQETQEYEGVIAKWKTGDKTQLMVLWDGKGRNETAILENMQTNCNGNNLNLKLLPYKDGRPAPQLQAQRPQAGSNADERAADVRAALPTPPVAVEVNDQVWVKADPEGVKVDARTQGRDNPRLNRGAEWMMDRSGFNAC